MSKIALTPNATGTGIFTISSPATSTDRTLTLPDEAGTVLTSVSSLASANLTGALPAISGAALTGVGASTTYGDVGTYAWGRPNTFGDFLGGSTTAALYAVSQVSTTNPMYYYPAGGGWYYGIASALSGTWRCMTRAYGDGTYGWTGLWVRIS
tara:strand:- start:74 stop:532 length:459 start_codon:yes stop_codon:yes gene_type:complete